MHTARHAATWVPIAMVGIASLTGPAVHSAFAQIPLSPDLPVKSLRFEWNAALSLRDPARLGSLISEDAVFLSTEVRLEGRDAIVEVLTNLYETRPGLNFTFTSAGILPEQPTMTDSIVSEYGTWRETWSAADGQVVQTGTYYDVWLRQPEGWRIALHAFAQTSCKGSMSICRSP